MTVPTETQTGRRTAARRVAIGLGTAASALLAAACGNGPTGTPAATVTMTQTVTAGVGAGASPVPTGIVPLTSPPPVGATTPPAAGGSGTALSLLWDPAGTGSTINHTLTCDPPAGDLADPVTACQMLATNSAALQPVGPDKMCTQQFGGPQRARISGTWRGRVVDAQLSRTNGCEIGRWDALAALLPPVTPVVGGMMPQ